MKLKIKYNGYLDDITKAYCKNIPKYSERASQTTSMEVVEEKTKEFTEAWEKIADAVTKAIEDKARQSFPYSIVNIHLVKVIHKTQADTMIFPYNTSSDVFLLYLIHELCHLSGYYETQAFREKFKEENSAIRQHIIVYAMLEYICKDVLQRNDYYELEKVWAEKNKSDTYRKAWTYVDQIGYKKILDEFIQTNPDNKNP